MSVKNIIIYCRILVPSRDDTVTSVYILQLIHNLSRLKTGRQTASFHDHTTYNFVSQTTSDCCPKRFCAVKKNDKSVETETRTHHGNTLK